jgi:hypothetical protein
MDYADTCLTELHDRADRRVGSLTGGPGGGLAGLGEARAWWFVGADRVCARVRRLCVRLALLAVALHVVRLGVSRLVVNELVAGRAVPAGLDGGAAGEVTWGVGRVGVPGPPVREQSERSGEFGALGGQLVGGPGGRWE